MGDAGRDSLIGQAIGGYVLERVLGEGGMGVVYLGVHPRLDRKVAVKVIADGGVASDARARFLEEAELAASLEHPAIVSVLDLATLPDGRLYMMMEYLEGEPLGRMLARRGALPAGEAIAIAVEALGGLAAAHARGVVHRDIKPGNLFVVRAGDAGRIKILDFGLAKVSAMPSPGRTHAGAIIGTPGYMAPEQVGGNPTDARADVYGLGAVLYEMLAGHPAFVHDDWIELLQLQRMSDPPVLDGITGPLRDVVSRALARAPEARFADAGAMRDALLVAAGDALAPIPLPEVAPAARASAPSERGNDQPSTRQLRRPSPHASPQAAEQPAPRAPESAGRERKPRRVLVAGVLATSAVAAGAFVWSTRSRSTEVHVPRDASARRTADDRADATPADATPERVIAVTSGGPPDAAIVVVDAPRAEHHERIGHAPPAPRDAGVAAIAARDAGGAVIAPPDATAVAQHDEPPDTKPTTYFTLPASEVPDAKAFDFTSHIAYAQALAHRIYADARLVQISGPGLRPDGTFDLTDAAGTRVDYYFRSDAHSGGGLRGQTYYCLVSVSLGASGIQVMAMQTDCTEPYFQPRCTGKRLVELARARGAPADYVATMHFYQLAKGPTWRLGFERSYDIADADCAH